MTPTADKQAGFTLIETLIALAVLAVGSVTLLIGVERHAAGVRGLSDRIMARWAGENALAARVLGIDMQPEWARTLGIEWRTTQTAAAVPRSGLHAVTVRVSDAAQQADAILVTITGYIALAEDTR